MYFKMCDYVCFLEKCKQNETIDAFILVQSTTCLVLHINRNSPNV